MPPKSPKETIKKKNLSFNEGKILNSIFNPVPFDIKLVFNPYLKDEQKYQYLVFKIKEYNNTVLKGQAMDSYEDMVHDRLRALMTTLGNMLTRDVQIEKMNQVYDWFKSEEILILQRKDQGAIRYKVSKQYVKETANIEVSPQFMKSVDYKKLDYKNMLPSEEIRNKNLPYIRNWRTTHKQIETPDVRLLEYQRKNLNFNPLLQSDQKPAKKTPRVLYPKIPKMKYVKEYQIQQGLPEDAPKIQNDINNPQTQPQSEIKQGQKPPEGQVKVVQEAPPVQDLGLGEQPEQPQQQQEPQDGDKLAPRLKSYIFQPTKQTKEQKYSHKRMNDRYLKMQNDFVKKQGEDAQFVQMMHSWAARKAQLDKEVIKRIQNMGIQYKNYQHSIQEPQKEEQFPAQQAKKYGLSKTFEVKKPKVDLDFSSQGFELPSINNKSQIYQKSIRKDKLNTLKKKFGKMLNIKDYDERDVAHSMCQVQSKRKGFSEILRKHSKSKERLKQLDQVIALKQKLASQKIAIDITTLSQSMCAPQDEQNLPEGAYPSKSLLSNPFWVQPAKKKKKKK